MFEIRIEAKWSEWIKKQNCEALSQKLPCQISFIFSTLDDNRNFSNAKLNVLPDVT